MPIRTVILRAHLKGDRSMADAPLPNMFAIVTVNPDLVTYGGAAPVFVAANEAERDRVAMWISRITNAIVHQLHDGTVILTTSS